jgi:hypothetical protein
MSLIAVDFVDLESGLPSSKAGTAVLAVARVPQCRPLEQLHQGLGHDNGVDVSLLETDKILFNTSNSAPIYRERAPAGQ